MLSRTAAHALRAVVFLAQRAPGDPTSVDCIATAIDAPRNYLGKTMGVLAKRGIVVGKRGPGGGFWLAVRAAELSVAQVVGTFDEAGAGGSGGVQDTGWELAGRRTLWEGVWRASRAPLERTTIADLLAVDETEAVQGEDHTIQPVKRAG